AGTQIPMPYQVLHELLGRIFRSPERFGTVFIIPALLFVGRTWGPLLAKYVRWQPVAVLAVLLVVVESRLYEPMPIQPTPRHYDFYEMMGQERGQPYDDYVVVEVPVAAGSGEVWVGDLKALTTQFYGITHEKRMVNGMIGRAPINNFWYLRTDDAMLSWLGQRRYLEPGAVEAQLRERIFAWPIGYVVVHQDLIGREGPTTQEIIGYLNSLDDLLCPLLVEGEAVVYRTAWHPDGCPARIPSEIEPGVYRIDIGSVGDERFIGWGWHWPESVSGLSVRWSGDQQQLIAGEAIPNPRPQADLYLDLPPAAYRLSLSAQAFDRDRQLTVRVNGTAVGTVTVSSAGLATHDVDVPAEIIGSGEQITVSFEYDGTTSAADVGASADTRQLGLMVDWIEFRQID
ncbi:MAG TPA: hypothetical protein VHO69_17950, partial [Phototrophicaceae bacterium]|nr:hypothetical protein [Phototrophicaceae bacterium]